MGNKEEKGKKQQSILEKMAQLSDAKKAEVKTIVEQAVIEEEIQPEDEESGGVSREQE